MIRLKLIARVVACWAISLAAFFLYNVAVGTIQNAEWALGVYCIVSLPLLAIAALACGVFARSIGAYPTLWSLSAVAAIFVLSAVEAEIILGGRFEFKYGLPSFEVSVPAWVAFMLSVWLWPLPVDHNRSVLEKAPVP